MANNLVGANIATRQGEGGANVMSWGNLDRAANQLYQEQKQREARGYNDYMQGQAALQKEFANVRSADIPDVVNAYNDLKKTKQAILFDDKIKNDAIQLAQKQQEANIKEAQLRQLINGSQQLKETDKSINARKMSHADDYDTEKIKQHTNDLNLSLLERIKLGRIDDTPYRYEGVDNAKLGQWAKAAIGTPRVVPIGVEKEADGGYKIEQEHVLRGNNPVQYADNLYKQFQTNKGGQAAGSLLNQMSDIKKQQIISQFNSIPDAEFKEKWGVDKASLVNGVLPDDKTGQYVLLDAMNYAVNNMPQKAESKFRPNEAFKTEQNKEEWNRRNGITYSQSLNKIEANKSNKPPEAFDFLKKGAEILGTGNKDIANQYFSAWKAASKKGTLGDTIGFEDIDYTPAGWIKIKYKTPITKNGATIGLEQETILNPKDPQLVNKLTGLHQQFLGSDVKAEKSSQGESMKGASGKPIKETKTFVFPSGKTKF